VPAKLLDRRQPADLENAKALYLGKSGRMTELMKGMAALSGGREKDPWRRHQLAKQAIEAALNARRQALADAELQQQLRAEALDVTLPGRQRGTGGLHPIALAWNASRRSLPAWALMWPKAPRSRPTGSASLH
jgi:phenylalanyl-tRNA synthetase alpha chain